MVSTNIIKNMASICPAFGMLGTLVGLIIMLDSMGADVSKIGPGMALAMLTTLYGVIFSQLIFKPAAEKLQQISAIFKFRNTLMMEGFLSLSVRENPLKVQDRLNSFLSPDLRFDMIKQKD